MISNLKAHYRRSCEDFNKMYIFQNFCDDDLSSISKVMLNWLLFYLCDVCGFFVSSFWSFLCCGSDVSALVLLFAASLCQKACCIIMMKLWWLLQRSSYKKPRGVSVSDRQREQKSTCFVLGIFRDSHVTHCSPEILIVFWPPKTCSKMISPSNFTMVTPARPKTITHQHRHSEPASQSASQPASQPARELNHPVNNLAR